MSNVSEARFKTVGDERFTFIDLFAGIGGFRLAMQECGGRCVFSSELNPNARKTYEYNYGELPYGDITDPEVKAMIPDKFDVLCGGFPCQAFSIAGKQLGFEDTRGTLFFDVADIIRRHRPHAVFLENVKNLETHDCGHTFKVIRATLNEIGYKVFHKVMDASVYADVPQHRERIFIVAFDRDTVDNCFDFYFPPKISLTKTIHDCIIPSKKPDRYYYAPGSKYYDRLIEDMKNPDTVYQWRRTYCRENMNNLCPTLTANMGGGGHNVPLILTPEGIRKLTPKECLNFMGYPDEFGFPDTLSESAMYMQAGNSVVVPLMKRIAENIIGVLFRDIEKIGMF